MRARRRVGRRRVWGGRRGACGRAGPSAPWRAGGRSGTAGTAPLGGSGQGYGDTGGESWGELVRGDRGKLRHGGQHPPAATSAAQNHGHRVGPGSRACINHNNSEGATGRTAATSQARDTTGRMRPPSPAAGVGGGLRAG